MKNKKIKLYGALIAIAATLVAVGKFLFTEDIISGLLIGIGAGLFGLSLAQLTIIIIAEKNPEYKRKVSIEENDERNMAINTKAKAKGFDAMGYILTILMLIFVFLNANLSIILLLVFAYLLVYGVFIFYLNKYTKEM